MQIASPETLAPDTSGTADHDNRARAGGLLVGSTKPPRPHVVPLTVDEPALLMDAARVGRLLALSPSTVWRMDAAGKLPKPLRLSTGTTRWRTDDIRRWVELGCPGRRDFEATANH